MPVALWWKRLSCAHTPLPGGAGVADRVVVGVRVADLDPVALAVALGARAGIDARVAGAERLEAVVEPVVGREREEAVLARVARLDPLHREPVGLEDVDVVEVRELDREVAQVDAVGAVGADHVELRPLAGDQDVRAPAAHALDLDVALDVADPVGVVGVADDRDQVLGVGALALVLVVRDLRAAVARDAGLEQAAADLVVVVRAARVRLGLGAARPLPVDARHDADDRPVARAVDRALDVAEAAVLQLAQPQAALALELRLLAGERPLDQPLRARLADGQDLVRGGAELRHLADAAVREERRPLRVRRRGAGQRQQHGDQAAEPKSCTRHRVSLSSERARLAYPLRLSVNREWRAPRRPPRSDGSRERPACVTPRG